MNMRTFYSADHHWLSTSIIKYCNRPFDGSTSKLMDKFMVDVWNSIVGQKDRVIYVGDMFDSRADATEAAKIFRRLNGSKFMVPGNHDHAMTLGLGWAGIKEIMQIRDGDDKVVACHYPLRSWPGRGYRDVRHVFGHVHGRMAGTTDSADVGVDCWDFRPVELSEIKLRMAMSPLSADPEDGNVEPDNGGLSL
jgi:calcineurin-like phosphoesterase family protein